MKIYFLALASLLLVFASCRQYEHIDVLATTQSDSFQPENSIANNGESSGQVDFLTENGKNTQLVFINDSCGYSLTFPDSWSEYFFVNTDNPDTLSIHFLGESKTGSVLLEQYGIVGLPWFVIAPEAELDESYDNIRLIGTANGVNYYYATGSASVTMLLSVSMKDTATYQMAAGLYDVDEHELQLAANDYSKLEQMEQEIDLFLESFEAIKE